MEARLLRVLAIVMAMIFAIPIADALNLGTLQKQSSASIDSGETAVFRTLFWSADKEDYSVTINDIDVPKSWNIIILPRQFQLGNAPSGKTERIYLPGNKNTIDAKAVDIYITAPEKTISGEYEIILNAVAGNNKEAGFSLVQERKLQFRVNVSGNSAKTSENNNRTTRINILPLIDETSPEETQSQETQNTRLPEDGGNKKTVSIALIFGILLIAWRLYKYD